MQPSHSNQPSALSKSQLKYIGKRKTPDRFMTSKPIPAKTLNFRPEGRGGRNKVALKTQNPTGQLRLLSYRQIQDQKLEDSLIRKGSIPDPSTVPNYAKLKLAKQLKSQSINLHVRSRSRDAWARTFSISQAKGLKPMVMVGTQLNDKTHPDAARDLGARSARISHQSHQNDHKVSPCYNTIANSMEFNSPDLNKVEVIDQTLCQGYIRGSDDQIDPQFKSFEVQSIQRESRGQTPQSITRAMNGPMNNGALVGNPLDFQSQDNKVMVDKEV